MEKIKLDIKTKEKMLEFVENLIDNDIDQAYRLANWLLNRLPYYELKMVYDEFKK